MVGDARRRRGHLADPPLMNILRTTIRRFDDWLSSVEGVVPFTDDPSVILRWQEGRLGWEVSLADCRIPAGSPVLFVHLWNERIPPIAEQGADLEWALQFQRRLVHSFRAVALHLQRTARMDRVRAVGGTLTHIHLGGPDGGRRLLEHLGFTIFPYHRPAGAFGEFWENFYSWMLLWAYNPPSMQSHALLGLQRNEFWVAREDFLKRFARS